MKLKEGTELSPEEMLAIMEQLDKLPERERAMLLGAWYPDGSELILHDVPEEARPRIRARIAPWLQKLSDHDFGISEGDCYAVAQGLTLTAAEPDVRYVEGCFVRLPWDKSDPAVEHGWNTVEGYRVDLMAEFYERNGRTWDEIGYEEIKSYSCEDILASFKGSPSYERLIRVFDSSGSMPLSGYATFQDAIKRLNAASH
jgi:hypothetical protein